MGGKLSKQELNTALSAQLHSTNIRATNEISSLSSSNKNEALDVLADAFMEDPMVNWVAGISSDDDSNKKQNIHHLCRYMMAFVNNRLINGKRGVALGIRQESTNELVGCMTLVPSRYSNSSTLEDFISVLQCGVPPMYRSKDKYCPTSHKRLEALEKIPKARKRLMKGVKRYVYLQTIGVASAHQKGKGYGSKLLRLLNQTADSLGVAVYLETESKENEGLYQHFGYQTLETMELSVKGDTSDDAVLTMYLMRRDSSV